MGFSGLSIWENLLDHWNFTEYVIKSSDVKHFTPYLEHTLDRSKLQLTFMPYLMKCQCWYLFLLILFYVMLFSKEIIFIRPFLFPLKPFLILQNIFFSWLQSGRSLLWNIWKTSRSIKKMKKYLWFFSSGVFNFSKIVTISEHYLKSCKI